MDSDTETGASTPPAKNRTTAALLALFLGWLGIHKFYLGQTAIGLLFLLTNTLGWVVTWAMFGIPNMLIGLVCFIEFIIYLTRTDEEFHRIYVVGRRALF